jgi:hypothetical protein
MRVEDQEKLRQFNSTWDKAHSTDDSPTPIDPGPNPTGESSSLMDSIASTINPATSYAVPPIPTTGDRCGQCNLLHPPVRPGETCPNAKVEPNALAPQPAPQPLTEDPVIDDTKPPVQQPIAPPPSPQPMTLQPMTPVPSEPAPLADNNIPTEIHVNKYLASWGDMIQAHCKTHGVKNVKKLMRHLTVEVDNFLGIYKEI